jgi:hypothetical protein
LSPAVASSGASSGPPGFWPRWTYRPALQLTRYTNSPGSPKNFLLIQTITEKGSSRRKVYSQSFAARFAFMRSVGFCPCFAWDCKMQMKAGKSRKCREHRTRSPWYPSTS